MHDVSLFNQLYGIRYNVCLRFVLEGKYYCMINNHLKSCINDTNITLKTCYGEIMPNTFFYGYTIGRLTCPDEQESKSVISIENKNKETI